MEADTDWFTVETIDRDTFAISEYKHWEETHCYLLCGTEKAILIDTGLGIDNIKRIVDSLTSLPVMVVTTHIHWDHIGGHKYFGDIAVHEMEKDWLLVKFPIPLQAVKSNLMCKPCDLPNEFDINNYEIFQGLPTKVLTDHDEIEIGGRKIEVLHTPGHSPGHLCFWERDRGYLFTGDLVYKNMLFAHYPSTDPAAYLDSLEKVAALPVKMVFPAHYSLDIQPEILIRMREAFRQLKADGKLHHGSGKVNYGDWGIWL